MTTKLDLYNGALRLCKTRKLASLSENRESRRLLDAVWENGATTGVIKHCLQLGQWTFAMRAIQIDYSPSVEPPFGYKRAFDQPSDLVKVAAICEDEFFNTPLTRYTDERHFWFADLDTIYVRYVSDDQSYGADLSLWPESFGKLVEAYLANEIVGNITQSDSLPDKVEKVFDKALRSAKSLDAMNRPTAFLPTGSWVNSRQGNSSRRGRNDPGYR